jgi:hypothetical protein
MLLLGVKTLTQKGAELLFLNPAVGIFVFTTDYNTKSDSVCGTVFFEPY